MIQAIKNSAISIQDITTCPSTLFQGQHPRRQSEEEITVFKSTGLALEDPYAAMLAYEQIQRFS
ncbi:MAG: hypothetical protein HRT36_08690 [Alphaproteobacteria bacterium]|nr:hypothetical protein [Alphaproteobacteria bacterium]